MKKYILKLLLLYVSFSVLTANSFDKQEEISSANSLAKLNIINDYSQDISKYKLDEQITRRELIKLIVNIGHISIENICRELFYDVKSDDWACKYVEGALKEGYISKSTNFRPEDYIKKSELLKLVFKSLDIKLLYNTSNWENNYINSAIDYGIINKSDLLYSGFDSRGRVFTVIYKSFSVSEKAKNLGYLNIQNNNNLISNITQSSLILQNTNISNNDSLGNNISDGDLLTSSLFESQNTTNSFTGSVTEIIDEKKCDDNYVWDGSKCIPNEKVSDCKGLPENASWNKSYKIIQYWDGINWMPTDNGIYNLSMTATECRFKCNNGFTWDGEKCIYGDKKVTCPSLPENASWNSVSSITQKWDGKDWLPKNDLLYSLESSDLECRFKCNSGYRWTGTAQNKCVKEDIIYGGGGGGVSVAPSPNPSLVNGTCSGIKDNGIFYNNSTTYNLVNAPNGTSLVASYNQNPGNNTCQFKCNTGYTWNGTICSPNNCVSSSKTVNGHEYVVPNFSHNSTTSVQSIISVSNGNKKYTQLFKCSLGNITTDGSEVLDLICNLGYVEGPNITCISNTCSGSISDQNAYSTATSQSLSQSWHYSSTPGVCTWNCNTGYTWNGTSCSSNSRISSCLGLPQNSSWNSVNSITQLFTGGLWIPTLTGTYNLTSSSSECRFKCNINYTWNGTSCIQSSQTMSLSCTGLPINGVYYNGSTSYTLSGATSGTSLTASYSSSPTQNTCQFKCNTGYSWNGSSCILEQTSVSWIVKTSMNLPRYEHTSVMYNGKIYVFGGYINSSWQLTASTEVYDILTNTWIGKDSLSNPRANAKSVLYNNKIYIIGGSNGNSLTTVDEYNIDTNVMTNKSSMNTPRNNHTVTLYNGKIYVIGGHINFGSVSSVEVYDIATNTWSTKSSMSGPRAGHRAELVDGKIYVFGGFNDTTALSSTEVYDIATNTWSTKSSMSTSRYDFSSVINNGYIYAIGGYTQRNGSNIAGSIEVYNPVNNTWTLKSSMLSSRANILSTVINGKIYSIAGRNIYPRSDFEIYDITTNNWSKKSNLITDRNGSTLHYYNGKLYIIGGYSTNSGIIKTVEEYDLGIIDNIVTGSCSGLPSNGIYYNGTASYSLSGATVGTSLVASYNATPNQNTCQFKCNTGYSWNGSSCIQLVSNWTIQQACSGKVKGNIIYEDGTLNGSNLTCSQNIAVCSGDSSGYIIQACNLGSVQVGTGSGNYGNYFQWGNNYGSFSGSSISTVLVDASLNGPGNYFNSNSFIIGSGAYRSDWTTIQNDNLWGTLTNNDESKQGPCPTGYHIPSKEEWEGLVSSGLFGTNGINFSNSLKLPFAGRRGFDSAIFTEQGTTGYYQTLSTNSSQSYVLYLNSNNITSSWSYYRSRGFSLRCFKNRSFVTGSCSGLPSNGIYYNGSASYSLSGATIGTSLVASYNTTPTQNTCQFKCNTGYSWNGSSCAQDTSIGYKYISAGENSACGIKSDGKLYCWGKNEYGQLGDGTTIDRLTPTLIDGTSNYKQVSMGGLSACGIKEDDKLYCWGHNWNNLGTNYSKSPKLMDSGNLYKKVSVYLSYICGIRLDGKLYCWGDGYSGQLGIGTKIDTPTPTLVDNGTLYADIITTNSYSTCGLTSLGKIKCWGNNNYGQFLDGTTTEKLTPIFVDNSNSYKYIGYNGFSFCGIRTDDKLFCWGSQIGDGTTTSKNTPTLIDGNNSYKYVILGQGNKCGVRTDNKLYCWGNNEFGELGDGTTTAKYTPTIGIDYNIFKYVSLGNGFNCGIGLNDKLYCRGKNTFGQLGLGIVSSKHTPTLSSTLINFKKVKTSIQHSCGISSDDKIYCWGGNISGQLGDGTFISKYVPTLIDSSNTYKDIALGSWNTCGIRTDGKLYCWGAQVGDGTSGYNRLNPVLIDGGNMYTSIYSFLGTTCGLRTTGKIYCWGENYNGQFLDGTKTIKLSPIAVDQNNTYTNIGVGNGHICGKRVDGKLYCWGWNINGQLGDGTKIDKLTPTLVDSGNSYTSLSLGAYNTCGIKSDGKYYCWGMIANGNLNDVTLPRLMDSVNTYKNTFGGLNHNCAIRSDDKVYCFGSNGSGEMGNGIYSNSSTYNLQATADNGQYKDLGLSWNHSCGVTIDGKLKCWGNGDYGQLGISGLLKITPTLVSGQ